MPEKTAQLLAGRYLLEEPIARGGMATVWRASDERLGRKVAVKVLHARLADDPSFRERFRREAVSAASFNHPHIVTVYDTGEDDGRHFIVMELVDGPSLARLLGPHGRLASEETVSLLRGILAALAYAHERGVVHRDIKPANILLSSLGGPGAIKVGDFGIARAIAGGDLTATGAIIGTASYLAPEQAEGKSIDHRADLFAVGLVAYRCLAGCLPWTADSEMGVALARTMRPPEQLRPLCPEAPRKLVAVIEAALARDPAARYQTAAQMAAALTGLRSTPIRLEPRASATNDHPAGAVARAARRSGHSGERVVRESPSSGRLPARKPLPPRTPARSQPPRPRARGGSTERPASAAGARRRSPSAGRPTGRRTAPPLARGARRGRLPRRARAVLTLGAAAVVVLVVIVAVFAGGEKEPSPKPTPTMVRLRVLSAFEIDPRDGKEKPALVPNAYDGDASSAWSTDTYRTREFGNLKDGLGLGFDLGSVVAPRRVTVRVTPGTSFELRTSPSPSRKASDWSVVASSARDATSGTVVVDTGAVRSRYWLLWITRLPEGRRAEVFDVTFGRS